MTSGIPKHSPGDKRLFAFLSPLYLPCCLADGRTWPLPPAQGSGRGGGGGHSGDTEKPTDTFQTLTSVPQRALPPQEERRAERAEQQRIRAQRDRERQSRLAVSDPARALRARADRDSARGEHPRDAGRCVRD